MAITSVTLVLSTPYRLRYLITTDNAAGASVTTLPSQGGLTPDLLTDLADTSNNPGGLAGPLRPIINSGEAGLGPVVASAAALTVAQARAFFNSDDAAGAVLTNSNVLRAQLSVTPREGTSSWLVDAAAGAGATPQRNGRITVTCNAAAAPTAASAYVTITAAGPAEY